MNPSRIKSKLNELGWSYAKFAEASGVSESTIKRVLSGAEPNASTAALIADALNTTVEWLSEPDSITNEPSSIAD